MSGAPDWLDHLDLRADGPPWLAMGLRRVDEAGWLAPDEHRASERTERARLLAQRWADVVHLGPDTEAAGIEVRDLVRRWLAAHGPTDLAGDDTDAGGIEADVGAGGEHPLVTAARLVQEDLVLMVPRPGADGVVRHHLDAAVLCFPSHWRLAEKAGGSAAAIHGPVPGYDQELSDRVDRYLARLRPGVIGVRRNWSVHDTPTLFAPDSPASPPPVPVDDVAGMWLRSERQTLRSLPASGAVLFTIRVQQCPLAALADRPDRAADMAARLRAQPADLVAMNGVGDRLGSVLAWLDRTATT